MLFSAKFSLLFVIVSKGYFFSKNNKHVGNNPNGDFGADLLKKCLVPGFVDENDEFYSTKEPIDVVLELTEWKPSTALFVLASDSSIHKEIKSRIYTPTKLKGGKHFPGYVYFTSVNSTEKSENVVVFELTCGVSQNDTDYELIVSHLTSYGVQGKFLVGLSPSNNEVTDECFDKHVKTIVPLLTNVPVKHSIGIVFNEPSLQGNETTAIAETYVTKLIVGLANETGFSEIIAEAGLTNKDVNAINMGAETGLYNANTTLLENDVVSLISQLVPVNIKEPEMKNLLTANCSWEKIQNETVDNFKNQVPMDVSFIIHSVQTQFEKNFFEFVQQTRLHPRRRPAHNVDRRCGQLENITRVASSNNIFEIVRTLATEFVDKPLDENDFSSEEVTNLVKFLQTRTSTMDIDTSWINSLENFLKVCRSTSKVVTFLVQLRSSVENKVATQQKLVGISPCDVTLSSVFSIIESREIITVEPQLKQFMESRPQHMDYLLKLVQYYPKRDTKITCEQNELNPNSTFNPMKLVVSGSYVAFSDFLSDTIFSLHSTSEWGGQCDGNNVKQLDVFASEVVYVDKSLDATGLELSVTVIAPVLHVTGYHQITLNGNNAPEIQIETKVNKMCAGEIGENGKNGAMGQNGGHFVAIFNKTTTTTGRFMISSNGGNGGDGHDGENGCDGKPGRKADAYFLPKEQEITANISKVDEASPGTIYLGAVVGDDVVQDNNYYCMIGELGTPGEKGGKGGDAGLPGNSGTIDVISTGTESVRFVSFSMNGQFGKTGTGGTNGRQIRGQSTNCMRPNAQFDFLFSGHYCWYVGQVERSRTKADDGSIPPYEPTHFSHKTNISQAIVRYKEIFFNKGLGQESFLLELDNHPKLLSYNSPMSSTEDSM